VDLGDQLPVAGVDRRDPAEVPVMLLDGLEPLGRHPAAADHVLEERTDLVGSLGTTEGQHQQYVVPPAVDSLRDTITGNPCALLAHDTAWMFAGDSTRTRWASTEWWR
jgi:hypothetical protein